MYGFKLNVQLPREVLDAVQHGIQAAWYDGFTLGFSIGLGVGLCVLVVCLMIRGK